MKDKIRLILKEEFSGYRRCSHFDGDNKTLCHNLDSLSYFLVDDLGLKDIINEKIKLMGEVKDLNDQYQYPLEILYNTNKFNEIKKEGDKYHLPILSDRVVIYDEDGGWSHVRKLNTNYSDLAELLTELFIRGGKVESLVNKNQIGLRKYLESIKEPLSKLVEKYFKLDELKQFVRNTKYLTQLGDEAENYVSEVLQKFGMNKLYQGGSGDFIDMVFGIDLIMEYKGRTITCQVKSKENALHPAMKKSHYRRIDYFISPINGVGSGIVIYNKEGKSFKIDDNGERLN